jgi:hypothetical protein
MTERTTNGRIKSSIRGIGVRNQDYDPYNPGRFYHLPKLISLKDLNDYADRVRKTGGDLTDTILSRVEEYKNIFYPEK